MTRNDKTIICKDCGRKFIFRFDEQNFFAEKGYDEPTRCKECRTARKNSAGQPVGRASDSGFAKDRFPEREMFPATCASCGKQTQLPFKPTNGGRPVYCSDCFSKNR